MALLEKLIVFILIYGAAVPGKNTKKNNT